MDYAIYRSAEPVFSWQSTSRIAITRNEFYYDQPANTNPQPGQRYYYWIGVRTPLYTYVEANKFASGVRALDVPVPIVTSAKPGMVRLEWDRAPGALDYAVFRSKTPTFEWKAENRLSIVSGHNYVDMSAPKGARVFYWICPRTKEFTYNMVSAFAEAYCPAEDFGK